MRKYTNSHRHPRRFDDFDVAVWLAGPCVLAMGLAAGCGSGDSPHARSPDGGFDLLPSPSDLVNDRNQAPPDSPLLDAPADGLITIDGDACQAPRVWRYQEPGCGAEAHPVCGDSGGDACLALACGCDGEILSGCDYYTKPWRSRGVCPGTCYSPTSNLEWSTWAGLVKGCTCDPASDKAQCVSVGGISHPIACTQGAWLIDSMSPCDDTDGGPLPPPLDGGLDQARLDGAIDGFSGDGTSSDGTSSDGTSSDDGGSCQAPNVWRYQNPGCGAEARPVCGSSIQDAGLAFACGCDGKTLIGFDYFKQPWSSRGVCPEVCYSPTHNLEVANWAGLMGCACNPATDATQCVFSDGWAGMRTIACVAGKWQLDTSTTCTVVDGGTVIVDGGSSG